MGTTDAIDAEMRSQWRELGFYYDLDHTAREWRLAGSRAGLLEFAGILLAYVDEPQHAAKSEHEHYGPYMYLEIMTWPRPCMDSHAISGPLESLAGLAQLVSERVSASHPGDSIRIYEEFSASSEYSLILSVHDDEFDPAAADSLLHADG
jgi:hypothetical protein